MKSELIKVGDGSAFKQNILSEWEKNASFWLEGRMKHIGDVKDKTVNEIRRLIRAKGEQELLVVDEGCGEGWLYMALKESGIKVKYVGLDFNEKFIAELKGRFAGDESADFILHDLEQPLPGDLVQKADIVVNAFNYFEIPHLDKAIENTSMLLREGGDLLVITIDPIMQLLAVSSTKNEFLNNLEVYAEEGSNLGYRKNIVIGNVRTNRYYYGILYSVVDYIDKAKAYGFVFDNYSEIIRPEKPTPQIFQFISFKKH